MAPFAGKRSAAGTGGCRHRSHAIHVSDNCPCSRCVLIRGSGDDGGGADGAEHGQAGSGFACSWSAWRYLRQDEGEGLLQAIDGCYGRRNGFHVVGRGPAWDEAEADGADGGGGAGFISAGRVDEAPFDTGFLGPL